MRTAVKVAPTIPPEFWDDFDPDFSAYRDQLIEQLRLAFLSSVTSMGGDVDLGRAHGLAVQWALERAGDLIGGKYDLGAATKDRLRELTAQAVENGLSPRDLANGLHDDIAFSPERAQTIARTETAAALGAGHRAVADEQGQDQKSWDASGEESCEDCQGNEADGWIDVDETFSDGSDDIPSHPNCTCVVTYRTSSLHEEDAAEPVIIKVARCVQCHRKLGEDVNVGARLHCPRCKDVVTVG